MRIAVGFRVRCHRKYIWLTWLRPMALLASCYRKECNTRWLVTLIAAKVLCISFQRNTGMLRFAQHDGGRLMCFTNLRNTTLA
jgi:hypothetical protein